MNLKGLFPYGSNSFFTKNSKTGDSLPASQPKSATPVAICQNCGKSFIPNKKYKGQFCSLPCCGHFMGKKFGRSNCQKRTDATKKRTYTCELCGKQFEGYKSEPKRFCSHKCSARDPGTIKRRTATMLQNPSHRIQSKADRGWRIVSGKKIFFRSRMEANYARYMSFMDVSWEYEPKTFWFTNIKRGVRSYTPDFYLPDVDKYIECKGWMDKKSATKLRRMRIYYPKVKIELIDYPHYLGIAKIASNIVPEWEPNKK